MSAPKPFLTDPFLPLYNQQLLHIYIEVYQLILPYGTLKCVLVSCVFGNCACALLEALSQGSEGFFQLFCRPLCTC